MTNEERDIQRKLRVLQHAEKIGNARKACRYFGSIAVGFGYDNSENVSLKGAFEAFSSQDGISGYSANLGIFMTF